MKPVSIPRERWQKIKRLYQEAIDQPSAERADFLANACGGDASLKSEVESLLTEADAASSFLELGPTDFRPQAPDDTATSRAKTPLAPESGAERLPVERVGAYRLVRRIGGGMGALYLGVRDDDAFKRRVAIKLFRREVDSADAARRFQRERQILARLDHENIAKLLDGGTTEDGRPYLVMEFVEGQPIDEFSDERRLSIRERLELFCTVCAAVQFAHRNLVVHRDLKPGNVLVTAAGVPKLLDFGVAKLLNPELAFQTTDPARTEFRLMTRDYASPEQARGELVTTVSDVYSLGVLLYELLTGHRPYRFTNRSLQETTRVICEQEPTRPSTAIARVEESRTPEAVARTREGRRRRLRRKLVGDLDSIVLMALRKEAQRRYASVEQLSEDISRHLQGYPVRARPTTFFYRTGKFLRRHTGAAAATVLAAGTLVGGIVAATWEWRRAEGERERAERRFADLRPLSNSLLFELHDAVAKLPGALPVRELLVKRALEHLDRLTKDSAGDPSLTRELAEAYRKVGDLQGNPANPNLGDAPGALKSYRVAQSMLAELASIAPSDDVIRRTQAAVERTIGDVLSQSGSTREALEAYRKSIALTDAVLALRPGDREARKIKFLSLFGLGDVFLRAGRVGEASSSYQEARKAGAPFETPDEAALADRMAAVEEHKGNYRKAADGYLGNTALFEALLDKDPSNVSALRGRALDYEKAAGALLKAGDVREARLNYGRAAELQEALLTADPEDGETRTDLARVLTLRASYEASSGRRGEARRLTSRALELARANADRPGASSLDLNTYAHALLVCQPEDMRQPAVALAYATRAVDMTQGNNLYLLGTLALAHFQRGDVERAIEIQEKVMTLVPPESADLRRSGEETLALFKSSVAPK